MFLQLFFICFRPVGPFPHILVAIGFVVMLCCFVGCWLFVEFVWYVFLENLMQNLLIFFGGMGFSILDLLLFEAGVGILDIILLEGISRHIS